MREVSLKLRDRIRELASFRCEYCLVPEHVTFAAHEIDHIISLKHHGESDEENLALSCAQCNKHKGSDVGSIDPDTGKLVALFHPRRDRWSDHFKVQDAAIVPKTAVGRVTVRLLQLNRTD